MKMRAFFCLFLIVPVLFCQIFGQIADETAARETIVNFYAAFESRNEARLRNFWKSDSPHLAEYLKQNAAPSATSEPISVKNIEFRQTDYKDEVLRLRVAVEIQKTPQNLTFLFVRENNVWKIWRVRPSELDFSFRLAAAAEAEREDLLRENLDLQNSALCDALYYRMFDHREAGNFELAYELSGIAVSVAQKAGDARCESRILVRRASVSGKKGDFARANREIFAAIEFAKKLNDTELESLAVYNAALIFAGQGNDALADNYYRQALTLAEKINFTPMILQILYIFSFGEENPVERLKILKRILKLSLERNNFYGEAVIMGSIARAYAAMGDNEKAVETMLESLKKFEAMSVVADLVDVYDGLSQFNFDLGRYDAALSWAEKSHQQSLKLGYWRGGLPSALLYKFKINRRLDKLAEAKRNALEAVKAVEDLRPKASFDENSQSRFLSNRAPVYENLVLILSELGEKEAALQAAELFKARTLFDVIHTGKSSLSKSLSATEREKLNQLKQPAAELNRRLRREQQKDYPNQDALARLENELNQTRQAFEEFTINLYATKPELRVERGEFQPISFDEINALFPDERTALLEFAVTDEKTFLYVVTKKNGKLDLRVHALGIKKADLLKRTEDFRHRLQNKDLDYKSVARELYETLLSKADAQLEGMNSLVIVPDSFLWDLPFQTLMRGGKNQFLLEDFSVSYAPSLTVLREMRKSSGDLSKNARLLAFGNPQMDVPAMGALEETRGEKLENLPAAELEVDRLAKLYGKKQSRIYKNKAATETIFKAVSGDFDILHLATHGVLNNKNPMYSALALTSDRAEDGLLEAWELTEMNLKADLVVLSACETGRGANVGEGIVGLSWAFFIAGTPRVVASQWKVESLGTAELMTECHRQMRASPDNTVAKSLRTAMLNQLKKPNHRHPFYWSGFVAIGKN